MTDKQGVDKIESSFVGDTQEEAHLLASNRRLQFHVKVLNISIVFLTCGCLATILLCHHEVQQLRNELDLIEPEDGSFPSFNSTDGIDDDVRVALEDLIGRRGAMVGGRRKREVPAVEEAGEGKDYEEDGGATTVTLDKAIWLNTFSKVQVEALNAYCSTMSGHCPPGREGEPGLPGKQGERGSPGLIGPAGQTGIPGFPGERGILGPKGDKGLPGPIGPEGPSGLQGLRGEIGLEGIPGKPGSKGEKGDIGNNGDQGVKGLQGPDGMPGLPGKPGEKGEPGYKGEKGDQGEDGTRGISGFPGLPGNPGESGNKGEMGESGEKGEKGEQGLPGMSGEQSFNGTRGILGIAGPPGPAGQKGDMGMKGEKGDIGSDGQNGEPGLPGVHGIPGSKGEKGSVGREGDVGSDGIPGRLGNEGQKGEQGLPGNQGEPGAKGDVGEIGSKGVMGPKGDQGTPGQDGRKGEPGIIGPAGPPGVQGKHGKRGKIGTAGNKGDKGDPGETGLAGEKGEIGPIGPRGEKGDDGEQGEDGEKGEKGGGNRSHGSGSRGAPGPNGLPGRKGERGDPGFSCGCTTEATTEATTEMMTTPEPTIEPRLQVCRIRQVGIPLFQKAVSSSWGAWMRDSFPHSKMGERYWMTRSNTGKTLYSYETLEKFKQDTVDRTYILETPYIGTGHVIYDGSFIYHQEGTNELVKFDLIRNETVAKVRFPGSAHQGSAYLYSTPYNYFDLSVDDNGLWVVYAAEFEPHALLVTKLNPHDLSIQKTWNVSVRHQEYGNGFIACGILYLIRNTQVKNSQIDFAYDLYTGELLPTSLRFNNPFQLNNMVSYNPVEKKIFSWDKGNQLIYVLLLD